jgi:hypothetical protein
MSGCENRIPLAPRSPAGISNWRENPNPLHFYELGIASPGDNPTIIEINDIGSGAKKIRKAAALSH